MNQSVHVSKNVHTHIVVIYLLVFSSIYFFWFATTKPRTHPTSFPPTHPSGNCRWLQGAPKRRASMNLQSKLPEHGHNWKRGRKTKKETMATGWKRGGGGEEKKRREDKYHQIVRHSHHLHRPPQCCETSLWPDFHTENLLSPSGSSNSSDSTSTEFSHTNVSRNLRRDLWEIYFFTEGRKDGRKPR